MANEKRVRNNNVQGTVAVAMNSTVTTLRSAGLVNLEAISSTEHAAIIIDPGRTAGAPEIVHVTAHTAASTSATVTRAREGTAARAHSATEQWVHAPTATIDYLPFRPPSVRVFKNNTQTTTSAAEATLSWTNEVFDTDSMWSSTAATRIDINTAGKYLVGATVAWADATTAGRRQLNIKNNLGDFVALSLVEPSTSVERQNVSGLISLTSTQHLTVTVEQNSGSNVATAAATTAVQQTVVWAIWQSS